MKTRFLTGFLVLVISMINGQNQRFTYEYHFAGNKTEPESFYTELMVLDVKEEGSQFYSIDKIKADSLMNIERQKQRRSGNRTIMREDNRSKVNYHVAKFYPNFKVILTVPLGRDTFIIHDARDIIWQVTPESKKIGEWETQRATTEFAGRKWEAWFTTSIPFPEGPYKFRGLPGLIVSVSSEDKTHQFQLVSVRNLNLMDRFTLSSTQPSWFRRQPLEVSAKQFVKQRDKYYSDPTAEFRQRFSGGRGFRFSLKNQDGTPMTPKDLEKIIADRVEKEKQENSNPLELDMVN